MFFDSWVALCRAVVTPALLWKVFFYDRKTLRQVAALPQNHRIAVVVGAGAPGVTTWRPSCATAECTRSALRCRKRQRPGRTDGSGR